jgi:hypothetical protein
MNILKHYEKVLDCMTMMSNDISELVSIISEQQKQINILTSCIEQIQDVIIVELERGSK